MLTPEKAFCIFESFEDTVGSPTCLEGEGEVRGIQLVHLFFFGVCVFCVNMVCTFCVNMVCVLIFILYCLMSMLGTPDEI